jgi:hypothetical protein
MDMTWRDDFRSVVVGSECYSGRMLLRASTVAFIFFLALALHAQQQAPKPQSALVVQGLGQGEVKLNGFWQFHTGDDPHWASPSLDDSAWDPITASDSWGSQGHPDHTGFAWYRRHLRIGSAPGANTTYALLIPWVDDAYEVYWNGRLIGRYGKLPPGPRWYYTPVARTFAVPLTGSGTIAMRVWKSPLLFVDSGTWGGMNGVPMLGDTETIAAQATLFNSQSTQQLLYDFSLMILYGFVALISVLLWSRDREVRLFLWLAIFTGAPATLSMLQEFLTSISFGWGRALNQPIYALNHISLWFLLLYLLRLDRHRTLVRWTRVLAACTFAAGILDGVLAFFWRSAGPWMQGADTVLTSIILLVEVFPIVIVAIGVRQRLDHAHWVVAISALVSQMIDTIADTGAAGQRFTHWTIFEIVNRPLFSIHGVLFRAAIDGVKDGNEEHDGRHVRCASRAPAEPAAPAAPRYSAVYCAGVPTFKVAASCPFERSVKNDGRPERRPYELQISLPAEDCHFVDVRRDRTTTRIGAVQLEVDEQVATCPAQTLRGITRRILESAMGSIHIHIVVSYIAAAVAMGSNLDVVPRVCSPILRIASNIGGVPVSAAGYRRELPGLGVAGTLGAIDHRLAV